MTQPRGKRLFALAIAGVLAGGALVQTGCTMRPKNDPFFGQQVVAAPATASAAGKSPPGKDYYPGNTGTRPGGTTAPSTGGGRYNPPGGFEYGSGTGGTSATRSSTGGFKSIQPNSSTDAAGTSSTGASSTGASSTGSSATPFRSTTPEATAPRTGAGGAQIPAENNQDRGSVWPGARSGAARLTTDGTRTTVARLDGSSGFTEYDSGDTPPPTQTDSSLFRPSSRIRSASYQEPVASSPSRYLAAAPAISPDASTDARYGYDPNYRWLKGKLEYLQASRRWKLRYVPFSRSAVDEYRGSVILADSPELESYRPGEFVTVHGAIDESAGNGYSATYRLARIESSGS